MERLKFKIIKSREQYEEYCEILEELVFSEGDQDEIDLLTLLIEAYDSEHTILSSLEKKGNVLYLVR